MQGTFIGHLVQLPCNEQEPGQAGAGSLQGLDIHNIFGQPVPVLHHPYCKSLFPCIQPIAILFKFKTISPFSVITDTTKESVSYFPVAPL